MKRDTARAAIWKGWALDHLGRYEDARASFVAAWRMLDDDNDNKTQNLLFLMALTGEMAATIHLGGQEECAGRLERALKASEASSGTPEGERARSSAHRILAHSELLLGRYESSEEEYRRAYDLALSANAPVEAVDALNGLAALHYFGGKLDKAEATWGAALKQAEQWDLVQHRSVLLSNLAELVLARGDAVSARSMLERAEALHRYLGSDRGLAETHRALSECHLLLGELEQAEAQAARGLALAERLNSLYMLGTAHRTMAKVIHALAKGGRAPDLTAVERHLDGSVAAFESAGMSKLSEETKALRAELFAPA